MSLFNFLVIHKEKPVSVHPWAKTIKDELSNKIKYAHNSVRNVVYPKPKEKVPHQNRIKFTVIGNRVSKEFIYCVHLVQGIHKYRRKYFDAPVIRGVTGVEWPDVLNDLKLRFGGYAFCITGQVAVLQNDNLLGDEKDLQDLIETQYSYHLVLDYQKESIVQFTNFIKSTGRAFAYMHIAIDHVEIGTLIFMLYSDIVPITCENFLRLCTSKKGGYSGTPIHRIVKNGWIQCGGFGLKYTEMTCENFIIPHDRRGVLGMANAGRHVDCSTQFYILLQPSEWMKHRFVAFGQLVDGAQTLHKIEKVATFYESPLSEIIIYKCGVLNVDCQDIMINKSTNAYIDAHIEDLVAVGELFYAMLLDHVYLEIEFRRIAKLEPSPGEAEALIEIGAEIIGDSDIRATKRFMRKKEDYGTRQSETSQRSDKDDNENNDFDVEDYNYEPEEYAYKQVTPAGSVIKPTTPYYIPLTDVKYPGEVDSNYDLKRFIQGDYCLKMDLDKKGVPPKKEKKIINNKINALSQVFSSYKQHSSSSEEEEVEEEEVEFDSDEEREIKKYLKIYAEQISFSGLVIRKIAKKFTTDNPIMAKTEKEHFTDEEVRRLKLASLDLKNRQKKKISISAEPWEMPTQIKRRQTGFMRPEDLAKILSQRREEDEEEEDEEQEEEREEVEKSPWEYHNRKVSISIPDEELPANKIKRRQTGFVRPADVAKLRAYRKSITGVDYDDDEDFLPLNKPDDFKVDDDDDDDEFKHKVRIAAPASGHDKHTAARRGTNFARNVPVDDDEDDGGDAITRPSVLVRLYDDYALDDDEPMPTLKDYKPLAEMKVAKHNLMLTATSGLKENEYLRRDNYHRVSLTCDDESFEQILALQHGKKIARKISSDYVKTIDQIEKKPETSIRSVQFARTRPSLTVTQYQLKNQLHAVEKRDKEERERQEREREEEVKKPKQTCDRGKGTGIRLPGDTPLYGSHVW